MYFQFACTKFRGSNEATTEARCVACSKCAPEIKPQVLLEHVVLFSLSSPAAIGWLQVSDGNITPQLTQNCTHSFAATDIYDLQFASLMPPNNKSPQICLHLQSNQTALSTSACFLVAFLRKSLFWHLFFKKGSWFHSDDNILLRDILFIKFSFEKSYC